MSQIVLQFSRPDFGSENILDKIISEGICKDTISEICHVDAVVPHVGGPETLIGAHIQDGIRERSQFYQNWGIRIRVSVPCTDEAAAQFHGFIISKIGCPYDAMDIVGLALHDGRIHNPMRLICSSFMTQAVTQAGIIRVAKDDWLVTPEELRLCATATAGATEQRIVGQ